MPKEVKPLIKFLEKDKLKIIKFVLGYFNNFTFGTFNNVTISVNQPIPTKFIIAVSNFAIRHKFDLEIDDKKLTFKYETND